MSDTLREDVLKFGALMSAAMDSKNVERESRSQPHYASDDYQLAEALLRIQDKQEQLDYYTRAGDVERARKTAVHLANFCMIVAAKLELGHSTTTAAPIKR